MKIIETANAPAVIGTYSQAVEVGNWVFLSGQIPLDPVSMTLVEGSFEQQVEQVFRNLSAVCEAAGGSLAQMVKLQIYVVDLAQFSLINEIMARYFKQPYPARAVVQVVALPKGAQVEIDGVMLK